MKRIAVPILIILVMTQAFSKWFLMAEFNVYRSYIAKNLCENRYRPALHCNGKCVLMKKMAAEENQSFPAGNIRFSGEAFLFIDNHIEYLGNRFPILSVNFIPPDLSHYTYSFVSGIFHPPLV